MTKTIMLAIVAAVMMTACGGSDKEQSRLDPSTLPEVSESYRLDGATPECWDNVLAVEVPRAEPRQYQCTWQCATLNGELVYFQTIRWEQTALGWAEIFSEALATGACFDPRTGDRI